MLALFSCREGGEPAPKQSPSVASQIAHLHLQRTLVLVCSASDPPLLSGIGSPFLATELKEDTISSWELSKCVI